MSIIKDQRVRWNDLSFIYIFNVEVPCLDKSHKEKAQNYNNVITLRKMAPKTLKDDIKYQTQVKHF